MDQKWGEKKHAGFQRSHSVAIPWIAHILIDPCKHGMNRVRNKYKNFNQFAMWSTPKKNLQLSVNMHILLSSCFHPFLPTLPRRFEFSMTEKFICWKFDAMKTQKRERKKHFLNPVYAWNINQPSKNSWTREWSCTRILFFVTNYTFSPTNWRAGKKSCCIQF